MDKTKNIKVKSLFDLTKEFTDLIAICGAVLQYDLSLPAGLLELLYKKSKDIYEVASTMYFENLYDESDTVNE